MLSFSTTVIVGIILHITLSMRFNYSPWFHGNSTMPRLVKTPAIGYDAYNKRIFIAGGQINTKQLILFDTNTFSFTDYGTNHLPLDIYQMDSASYYSPSERNEKQKLKKTKKTKIIHTEKKRIKKEYKLVKGENKINNKIQKDKLHTKDGYTPMNKYTKFSMAKEYYDYYELYDILKSKATIRNVNAEFKAETQNKVLQYNEYVEGSVISVQAETMCDGTFTILCVLSSLSKSYNIFICILLISVFIGFMDTKRLISNNNILLCQIMFIWIGNNAQTVNMMQKILPNDGLAGDSFGTSVSISGNYTIIGANQHDENGIDSGAAYIFKLDSRNNAWSQIQKLVPSDGTTYNTFGWSVSISDNYAIIGAIQDEDNGSGSGSAYIFELDLVNDIWSESQKLRPSDGKAFAQFGYSVSISGVYAIVGAANDDAKGSVSGAAYIFKLDTVENIWNENMKLVASDGSAGDFFGCSVFISGNYAIIGAYQDDDRGIIPSHDNSGSAYIFRLNLVNNTWSEMQKLVARDWQAGDHFGISVSISSNYAIIGADYDGDKGIESGSAYVFKLDLVNNIWNQTQKLVPTDGAAYDHFGYSVCISGEYVMVSAYGDDSAYIFTLDPVNNIFHQSAKLEPNGATQGNYQGDTTVSISGDYAIVGTFPTDSAYISRNYASCADVWNSANRTLLLDTYQMYLVNYSATECVFTQLPTLPTTTNNLSENPTQNPTRNPTQITTNNPTSQQTYVPTISPSIISTLFLSTHPNESTLYIPTLSPSILYCIIIFGVMIVVIGWIDSKCWCRRNDFFKISLVISALLQILDFITDIFFAVSVFQKYKISNMMQFEYLIISITSLAFIIIPIGVSMYQLFNVSTKWIDTDNRLREWFKTYNKMLFILCAFTGSAFSAVSLCNSNIFGTNLFCMGLSRQCLSLFSTKKIYSVILLENIPQLVIIIWYWFVNDLDDLEYIPLIQMIFSLLSIMITVVSLMLQKRIYKQEVYLVVSFDVTDQLNQSFSNSFNVNQNKIREIKMCVSSILGVNVRHIEAQRPFMIRDGLRVKFYIASITDQNTDKCNHFQNLLNLSNSIESLGMIVAKAWKLKCIPFVSNMQCELIELHDSKNVSRKNTSDTDTETTAVDPNKNINSFNIVELIPTLPGKMKESELDKRISQLQKAISLSCK